MTIYTFFAAAIVVAVLFTGYYLAEIVTFGMRHAVYWVKVKHIQFLILKGMMKALHAANESTKNGENS